MYTEEYKNAGDLYKAKTFRTIQYHILFYPVPLGLHESGIVFPFSCG